MDVFTWLAVASVSLVLGTTGVGLVYTRRVQREERERAARRLVEREERERAAHIKRQVDSPLVYVYDRETGELHADRDPTVNSKASNFRWRVAIAAPFVLTLALAALTLLGYSLSTSSTHMTGVEVFTELAGAGTLLSGIGAMVAVWLSYLDRKRKGKQDFNAQVINHVIERMDGPLRAGDLQALADFARALNESPRDPQTGGSRQAPAPVAAAETPAQAQVPPPQVLSPAPSPVLSPAKDTERSAGQSRLQNASEVAGGPLPETSAGGPPLGAI